MIAKAAKEAGFIGGIVVDNPDSEKKKKYVECHMFDVHHLCLC